jgi:hypothetical protein
MHHRLIVSEREVRQGCAARERWAEVVSEHGVCELTRVNMEPRQLT